MYGKSSDLILQLEWIIWIFSASVCPDAKKVIFLMVPDNQDKLIMVVANCKEHVSLVSRLRCITKTCLFNYIENFTTKI